MRQFLSFEIAGRRFGLSLGVVQEVTRAVAVTALPQAPPIVEGVINVRGTLAPVLDIRQRFGLPPAPAALEQHLLIAQAGTRLVALRVDRAIDLVDVAEGAIESATRAAPGAEHVVGLAKLPDGVLVIHDLERFLSLDESRALEASLSQAPGGGHSTD